MTGAHASDNAHVGAIASDNDNAHVDAIASDNNNNAHVGALTKLDAAIVRTQAKEALIGLGWKPAIAQTAVAAAVAALGLEATLDRLIFEALRRCPRPTS